VKNSTATKSAILSTTIIFISLIFILFLQSCFSLSGLEKNAFTESDGLVGALNSRSAVRSLMKELSLVVYADDGTQVSRGSGFLFTPDIAVTAYHVIEGKNSAFVEMDLDGLRAEVLYVQFDIESDIALLFLDTEIVPGMPQTYVRDWYEVGDLVYIMSSPLEQRAVFNEGIISNEEVFRNFKVIEIRTSIDFGSSGGLVMTEDGDILGVITTKLSRATPYAHATTSGAIWSLFTANGPYVYMSELASTYIRTPGTENWNNTIAAYLSLERLTLNQPVRSSNSFISSVTEPFTMVLRNNSNKVISSSVATIFFSDFNGSPLETVDISFTGPIYPGAAVTGSSSISKFVIQNAFEVGSIEPYNGFRYSFKSLNYD